MQAVEQCAKPHRHRRHAYRPRQPNACEWSQEKIGGILHYYCCGVDEPARAANHRRDAGDKHRHRLLLDGPLQLLSIKPAEPAGDQRDRPAAGSDHVVIHFRDGFPIGQGHPGELGTCGGQRPGSRRNICCNFFRTSCCNYTPTGCSHYSPITCCNRYSSNISGGPVLLGV